MLLRVLMRLRIRIFPFEQLVVHVPEGASVLDVGCGSGLFLIALAATKSSMTGHGFDTSTAALALARHAWNCGAPHSAPECALTFSQSDANAAWPDGPFDVVSIIDVMHHLAPDVQAAVFAEAVAHLKPGGRLLYKDMANRPWFPAAMNRLHDLLVARQWIHYRSIDDVDRWATAAGFATDTAFAVTKLWYRHEVRVYRAPS